MLILQLDKSSINSIESKTDIGIIVVIFDSWYQLKLMPIYQYISIETKKHQNPALQTNM